MPFPTHAFYKPGSTTIQDIAVQRDGAWFGGYSGDTEAAMLLRAGAVLMAFDAACEATTAAQRATYCRPPSRVTRKAWWDALEVLPPCRWTRMGRSESFHVSERITGDLVDWWIRVGEHDDDSSAYWHLVESSSLKHDELMRRIGAL